MRLTLNIQIAIGAAAGIAAGAILGHGPFERSFTGPMLSSFALLGKIFISLLKMVLVPLIFTSVAVGIANLRNTPNPGRAWPALIAFFTTSTTLAVLTGLAVVNIFKPGQGLDIKMFQNVMTSVEIKDGLSAEVIHRFIDNIFVNPLTAMASSNILAVVLFAMVFGIAMVVLGDRCRTVLKFTEEILEITMTMIGWILRLAPFGIMGLLAALVASQNMKLISVMGHYMAVVTGATLFHGLVTLPFLLWILTKRSPIAFFLATREALMTAFATSSSSATLPVGLRCVTENLKVDKNVAGFVLPVGATLNMDGTALYEAIAALFIANLCGVELSFLQQAIVAVTAMIASVGAPGIPSAGMVTMILVLQSVGLPGEAVAILIPIDRPLDTIRTVVNVQGDYIAACVVEKASKNS